MTEEFTLPTKNRRTFSGYTFTVGFYPFAIRKTRSGKGWLVETPWSPHYAITLREAKHFCLDTVLEFRDTQIVLDEMKHLTGHDYEWVSDTFIHIPDFGAKIFLNPPFVAFNLSATDYRLTLYSGISSMLTTRDISAHYSRGEGRRELHFNLYFNLPGKGGRVIDVPGPYKAPTAEIYRMFRLREKDEISPGVLADFLRDIEAIPTDG